MHGQLSTKRHSEVHMPGALQRGAYGLRPQPVHQTFVLAGIAEEGSIIQHRHADCNARIAFSLFQVAAGDAKLTQTAFEPSGICGADDADERYVSTKSGECTG